VTRRERRLCNWTHKLKYGAPGTRPDWKSPLSSAQNPRVLLMAVRTIAARQIGFGFGKGRRVVLPWPRRPKLRMAKARLR
jgi:hypothetical protein